jgi:hypothetical protein
MRVLRIIPQFFFVPLLLLACGVLSAQKEPSRIKNIVLVRGASGWRSI